MNDPPPLPDLPPEDEADLAELADGRLDRARAAALEARAAEDPVLAAALDDQRSALRAIRTATAGTEAPPGLRARVRELERASRAEPPARAAALPRRRRRLTGLGLRPIALVAAALVAVLVVVTLAGGGPQAEDALAFAGRPATAEPRPDPAVPQLLEERVESVQFPNYAAKFGWRPTGTRTDDLGDHSSRTVFYARGDREIAYTIIGGEALPVPEDAPLEVREGTELRVLREGSDPAAVTWRRGGRTCVLSGEDVPTEALLELAGWKGKGAVEF